MRNLLVGVSLPILGYNDGMDQKLQHTKELLTSYKPKAELLAKVAQLKLGILVGPAGSGKDTLRDELIKVHSDSYQKLLSNTSRPMRPGEKEGDEYYFKSFDAMLTGLEHGDYLQGAVIHEQQLSGIHHDTLQNLDDAKISLPIVVVATEREIHHLAPHARTIFLVPPSAGELRSRLYKGRNLSMEEIARRLSSAKREITQALTIPDYYFIVTDTIPETVKAADEYLRLGQRSEVHNLQARITAQKVLSELDKA